MPAGSLGGAPLLIQVNVSWAELPGQTGLVCVELIVSGLTHLFKLQGLLLLLQTPLSQGNILD